MQCHRFQDQVPGGWRKTVEEPFQHLGAGLHCGRTPCPPCDMNGDKRGNCRSRNLLYESRCLICNTEDRGKKRPNRLDESSERKIRKGIYIGESPQSIHERSLEHVRDAYSFSHKSHIIKHWLRHHIRACQLEGETFFF